jgi:hypothetical protein
MEHTIKLTVEINGQEFTRNYKFTFGKFEDKDWNTEMDSIFGTYLENLPEPMTADDYADLNLHPGI